MTEGYIILDRASYIHSETNQRVVLNPTGREMVGRFIKDLGSLKNLMDKISRSYTGLNKLTLGGYCHPTIFDDVYTAAKEYYAAQQATA